MLPALPWYLGNSSQVFESSMKWIFPLSIWSIAWTGACLWVSARKKSPGWFIFFLLVHTAGVIEFIYLYFIAKVFEKEGKKEVEVVKPEMTRPVRRRASKSSN